MQWLIARSSSPFFGIGYNICLESHMCVFKSSCEDLLHLAFTVCDIEVNILWFHVNSTMRKKWILVTWHLLSNSVPLF